ncbi:MAG: hypothetical protein IPG71_14220 [bacterium]|nr:hypothetical protein [bacterium]
MRRTLAICLITGLALLAGSLCAAERAHADRPKKSTTGAVFRSLAVPGWGQFYTESYAKAVGFFAAEAFVGVAISRYHDQMMASKKADVFENERFYRSSRNKMIWWAAAIKLLSMGDAYVNAQLYKIDISPSLTPENEPGVMFSATVRF